MKNKILRTALESISETVVITEPEVQPVTVEETIAQHELANDQGAADQLMEASISLEEVLDQLNEALDEGGASDRELSMARTAVNAVTAPIGMEPQAPALESGMSRSLATRLTMESVSESLIKIWEAIVAFGRRIWNAVVTFFRGQKVKAEKLHENGEALLAQIKERRASGKSAKLSELPDATYAAWINTEIGMAPGEFLHSFVESAHQAEQESVKYSGETIKEIVATLEKYAAESGKYVAPTVKTMPLRSRYLKVDVNAKQEKHGFAYHTYLSPVLPGGFRMKVVRPADDAHRAVHRVDMAVRPVEALKVVGDEVWAVEHIEGTNKVNGKPVAVASLVDLEALLAATIAASKQMVESCNRIEELHRAQDAEIKKFETVAMKWKSATSAISPNSGNPSEALRAFQRLQRSITAPVICMNQYLSKLIGAYLGYAKTCLDLYTGEGEVLNPEKPIHPALPGKTVEPIEGEFTEVK